MAWAKAKTAAVAAIGILAAAGTTTVVVREVQDHRVYEWQKAWPGASYVNQVTPQVTIRPAPRNRKSLHGRGTSNGKTIGLGYDFAGMVKGIYQIDSEHLLVSAPLPAGTFDWLANLSAPDDYNFGLNLGALGAAIKKQFGLQIHRQYIETNALILTVHTLTAALEMTA